MTFLRLLLTTLVLLAQGWPAQAGVNMSETACEMGCCAWLAEAEMSVCACTDAPVPASPASTPPAAVRELVPQITWVSAEDHKPDVPAARGADSATWSLAVSDAKTRPHVRLAVLFCSFLN